MTKIVTPSSHMYFVDALLGDGPHWDLLPADDNTIRYTFAVTDANGEFVTGAQAFTPTQQANARDALAYISQLTGIRFLETADAAAAHVHLACADLLNEEAAGVCISSYSYTDGPVWGTFDDYTASSYIYIDNQEWFSYNGELVPGTEGYEILLHELGHMLGLKHPFEEEGLDYRTTLPYWLDHTTNTLMSYTSDGAAHSVYSPYDIAALTWIYGGDGLGGKLGAWSPTKYYMGTDGNDGIGGGNADDLLEGGKGNDDIHGGGGTDTVVFSGPRDWYDIEMLTSYQVRVTDRVGQDGSDTVSGVTLLFQFSDGIFNFFEVTGTDGTPPPPPAFVLENANGKLSFSGTAEPGALVEVGYSWPPHYAGYYVTFGTTHADANGVWSMSQWVDNNSYLFNARATDANGNVGVRSADHVLMVDAVLPAVPTMEIERDSSDLIGGNRPVVSGTAHPGSKIEVHGYHAGVIATTTADADGNWAALGAELGLGYHHLWVVATAPEGREMRNPTQHLEVLVDPAAGFGGTDADDRFMGRDGVNTYGGGAGVDTVEYAGPHTGYAVSISERGVTVIDTQGSGGRDTLFSVERLQFGDTHYALDIQGIGGQAYRIYQAAFDRAPERAGVGYWMARMDAGVALATVAQGFIQSAEFVDKYGANPTSEAFIAQLYQHVLDRAGEQEGFDFWVAALNEGRTDRASVLAHFSESLENVNNVALVIGNGFSYLPPG